MRRFVAAESDVGRRLDAWLADAADLPRSRIAGMIRGGLVRVSGKVVQKAHRVSAGEVAEFELDEGGAPPSGVTFEVRWEDEHLAVVSKPAGVLVHRPSGGRTPSLAEALEETMPLAPSAGPGRPGVVHRLDRDTSGLLVFAKTDEAYALLVEMMKERRVHRAYLALVMGGFDAPTGRIEAPVGRVGSDPRRRGVTGSGKPGTTIFRVEEPLKGSTLVQASLVTGRTHQIRVHFAHIGHPVIGDPSYGKETLELAGTLGLTRPFLHAAILRFTHPLKDREISVSEELPEDLRRALERARHD